MSELLNRFEICSKISENLKLKIKIFHVFYDGNEDNILFITSDDEVYGFGSNDFGCCGLGHNSVVNEPQIIPELCHKNVQQFFIGGDFVLCLTTDKRVYGWGSNNDGQLGRGYIERNSHFDLYFKPKTIKFSSESVIQLSCGESHSLALTEKGKVFGWGNNARGQIGCGEEHGDYITSPLHLDIFPQFSVKTINCFEDQSYALTTDGLVHSWGWDYGCSLGHKMNGYKYLVKPEVILNIPKIINLCHSQYGSKANTYFLTDENEIYFCGCYKNGDNLYSTQKFPRVLKTKLEFTSLYSGPCLDSAKPTALSSGRIFELLGNGVKETDYNSYFEYYSNEYEMSYKTIHINSEYIFDGNDLKVLQSHKIFEKNFINCIELGAGAYGTVLKVKNKFNHQYYAVKRIPFKG